MDFHELFNILQTSDETDRIEAKAAGHGIGKSFLETVSAFSNEPDLGGGYILLGITQNEGEPRYVVTGISDPDRLQNEIASQCRLSFNVLITPTIKVISHPQGTVLLVYIPEAGVHEKPVYIKSKGREEGAYRRIGSSDYICTREDLDLLYRAQSKRKYDETLVENATFSDFDPKAIQFYRFEREKIKADSPELRYNDIDLLKALRAMETENGATHPTVGGLLLFGNEMALKRIFSLRIRIDYILVEGRDWMVGADRRYTAVEVAEALITGIPRLINQIMIDIPQVFALEEDEIRRKDNPLIPRKVIREAVVNALMHRDYYAPSPTQIIKYANRFEFRNAGYSLKPQDQLGLPGSVPRNQILSRVFNDIQFAEAKGTGISTMREEMVKANLSMPLFESNRGYNTFMLTLLPHHLFSKKDVEWLAHFKEYSLSNEEARTLIVIREKDSINNAEYRTINGVDTLTASSHLRRLRDHGLLEQKGSGNTTYYVPTKKLLAPHTTEGTPVITEGTPVITEGTPVITEGTPVVTAQGIPPGFPPLPGRLIKELQGLNKRKSVPKLESIILQLCALGPLKLPELAEILRRKGDHLRKHYVSKMLEAGKLEYLYPEQPFHPQQAYRTKK